MNAPAEGRIPVAGAAPSNSASPNDGFQFSQHGLECVPAIRAQRLVKVFGARVALRSVDLTVNTGERIALLGPNGAGKTTLLRVLALLTRPTSGAVEISGLNANVDAQEIRSRIGACLHESLLYPDLTVVENLRFFARLYRVRTPAIRIASLIERFQLDRLATIRVRNLSRGQRQRTSLARALVHDPRLLLLDEADTGQDIASAELMQTELTSDCSRTIVFATHQPFQALALATRVLMLDAGRLRDLGPAAGITGARLYEALLAASR